MLRQICLKNLLLVESAVLDFTSGLCVITGETGAGKSIILNSVLLSVGKKTKIQKTNIVSPGANFAEVTALFEINSDVLPFVLDILCSSGIELFNDNELIVRRVIDPMAKVKTFINDKMVSSQLLSKIGDILLEFHTQNEQGELMNEKNHLSVLDEYSRVELLKAGVGDTFLKLSAFKNELEELQKKLSKERENAEYNANALKELKALGANQNEELEIVEKRKLMLEQEKQDTALQDILLKINPSLPNGQKVSFRSAIGSAIRYAQSCNMGDVISKLDNLIDSYDDLESLLSSKISSSNFSSKEFEVLDERLALLRSIAKKYKIMPSQIPTLISDLELYSSNLKILEDEMLQKKKQIESEKKQYLSLASQLSEKRTEFAKNLSASITAELVQLGFDGADFLVEVESNIAEEVWSKTGLDRVYFKVRTNKGMPYGSIANIASGGEVSRFMLAIKIVLNNQKLNSVIIFDEIDAGVGGKTAEIMGKKIKQLSKSRQIILITHQPQIAVFSDSHFKIEKHSVGNEDRVVTTVKNLSKDEKTAELARMLFGNKVDEQSMAVVKSMVISSSTSNS